MTSLIRILIALVAAFTVCVAGWAGLHALGVKPMTVAAGPVDLQLPEATVSSPARPGLPPFGRAVEASAGRATERARVDVDVELRGATPAIPLVLRLVSDWSGAPLAQQQLDADTVASGHIRFAGVPAGTLWAVLLPAATPANPSYLARSRVTVPSADPVAVDGAATMVRVRVRRQDAPWARALIRIARTDDATWVLPLPDAGDEGVPLTDAAGEVSVGPLGAGTYRAWVAGEPLETAATFELPGSGVVEISVPSPR